MSISLRLVNVSTNKPKREKGNIIRRGFRETEEKDQNSSSSPVHPVVLSLSTFKAAIVYFLPCFLRIINFLLQTGTFPSALKEQKVIPSPKEEK